MMRIRNTMASGLAAALLCATSAAADERDAVKQTMEAYEQAWSRHDAHAVADFYFEPAMRVSKGGPVVRATRADQPREALGAPRAGEKAEADCVLRADIAAAEKTDSHSRPPRVPVDLATGQAIPDDG